MNNSLYPSVLRLGPQLPEQGDLQPITFSRLMQFESRSRQLAWVRGLSIMAAVWVSSLTLAVLVDAGIESTWARWTGSLVMYGAVLATANRFCLRLWRRPVTLTNTASRFEQRDYRLRDKLLSAVELSLDEDEAPRDSIVFRQQLQLQVAEAISPTDPKRMLPWTQIRRFLIVGAVAIAALLVASCIPGLRLPHRAARVLLPGADLGRFTNIAIRIVSPMPASKTVPAGDVVAVRAGIEGPRPNEVWLEIDHSDGMRRTLMSPVSRTGVNGSAPGPAGRNAESLFQATFPIDRDQINYRVAAAGASTPWHRLLMHARPKATHFQILISPPTYTGLQTSVLESDDGNFEALIGSRVELRIAINQPVAIAALRWERNRKDELESATAPYADLELSGDLSALPSAVAAPHAGSEPESQELLWDPDRQVLVGTFVVDASTSYRVFLQDKETGFTNEFSPQYRISAIADAAPQVEWTAPKAESLIASPTEVLGLNVNVVDELSVAQLTQLIRVNSAARVDSPVWKERPLAKDAIGVTSWEFDLMPLLLDAGDYLETKVAARDRKGNIGESEVLKVLISSTSIDLTADQAELRRLRIAANLEALAVRISESVAEIADADQSEPEQVVSEATLQALSGQLRKEIGPIIDEIKKAASLDENSLNSLELRLVAEALTVLMIDSAGQLDGLVAGGRGDATKLVGLMESRANSLASQMRNLGSHDTFSRHAEQLSRIRASASELAHAPDLTTQQMRRRHEILIRQMGDVQQAMLDSIDKVRPASKEPLRRSAENLGNLIEQTERKVNSGDSGFLADMAQATADSLQTARLLSRLDSGLSDSLRKSRRELLNLSLPVYQPIADLAGRPADTKSDGKQYHIQRVLDQLELRRSILRAAGDGNQALASDVGTARRAVESTTQTATGTQETQAQLRSITNALQSLVAAHEVDVATSQLRGLLRGERWGLDSPAARIEHPRVWDAYPMQIENAKDIAKSAGWSPSLVARIDRLGWDTPAKEAARRITSRQWDAGQPQSAANQLEEILQGLQAVQREMKTYVTDARKVLASLAPNLEELAQRAAESTRELGNDTQSTADAVRRDEVPDNQIRLQQLHDQLAGLADPIDDLREALVDQADTQDLLVAEERELARQADAAIEVVDRAEQRAKQSLEDLPMDRAEELADALDSAAQQQDEAAAALEQLARLFAPTSRSQPSAEADSSQAGSSDQLSSEIEKLARELDDSFQSLDSQAQYDQAEELSDLGEASPEAVLQRLEEQLKNNQPMREEMSDIARAAAGQALDSLEQAAQWQSQIVPDLEDSDIKFGKQKRLLLHDLQVVRESAFQSLGLLLNEAKWTAGAARESDEEKKVEKSSARLRNVLESSEQATSAQSFAELQHKASALRTDLDGMSQELAAGGKRLLAAGNKQFHQNGADLNNRRREMRERQRRIQQQDIRNLQQTERSQLTLLRQAEKDLQKASQLAVDLRQNEAKIRKQMRQSKDASSLQPQLSDTAERLQAAIEKTEVERAMRDAAQERVDAAQQALSQGNKREQPALDGTHPSAQLSGWLAQLASDRSRALADMLREWTADNTLPPRASQQGLTNSLDKQNTILREVELAAEHLARAGRHEARLDHATTSGQLHDLSSMVELVRSAEVQAARAALVQAKAEDESEESGASQAMANQASAEQTALAIAKSTLATAAIEHAEGELRRLLSESEGAPGSPLAQSSPPNSASNQSSPSQPNEQSASDGAVDVLEPEEMAQMLDELDRMLLSNLNLGPQEDNSQGPPGEAENSEGQAEEASEQLPNTLAEAAKQLASQLSQSRDPLPPDANSDLGMATESQLANVEPQGPTPVRVVDIDRIGGDWGELREAAAEGNAPSRVETLSPRFRAQIEAYFRSVSIESRQSEK